MAKKINLSPGKLARLLSKPLLFLVIVFSAVSLGLLAISSFENVPFFDVSKAFFNGSFFSKSGILNSMTKTVPLLITSLGLLIAFKSKLWNVGGEGQIALGVIATLGVCLFIDLPSILIIILAFSLSFFLGGIWGSFAGFLKSKMEIHEIPITLMQNFIVLAFLSYLIAGPWNPAGLIAYPRTDFIPNSLRFPFIIEPLNTIFLFALALIPIIYLLMNKTCFGFKLNVVGKNPYAAEYAGINSGRITILAMFLSGAICGLAGTSLVVGEFFFGVGGITGNFGFYAIVCLLIARLRPELTLFTSFFVGGILMGAAALKSLGLSSAFANLSIGIVFVSTLILNILEKRWDL